MNGDEFRKDAVDHFGKIMELNERKGADYAQGNADAFDNFRRHAAELGLEPEQIWAVYASKHWDAVMTFVKRINDEDYMPSEAVDGRIDDLILYLFLFRAMIHDETPDRERKPAKFRRGDWVVYRADDSSAWRLQICEVIPMAGGGWHYTVATDATGHIPDEVKLPNTVAESRLSLDGLRTLEADRTGGERGD